MAFDPSTAQIVGQKTSAPKASKGKFDPSTAKLVTASTVETQDSADNPGFNIQQMAKGVLDTLVGTGVETVRGAQTATSNVAGNLNMAAEAIGQATGTKPGGLFKGIESMTQQSAENLPQTNLSHVAKATYNMAGAAVPMVAEYALIDRAIGPVAARGFKATFGDIKAVQGLTESSVLATQAAINEYRASGGDVEGAVKSGATGAAIGLGMGIAQKGLQLVKQYGKGASKAFIRAITDNEALADDFVNNPAKYVLNPFKKVEKLADVTARNEAEMFLLRQKEQYAVEAQSFKHAQEKQGLSSELDNALFKVRESNKATKASLEDSSKATLNELTESATKSMQASEKALQDSLYGDFKHANEQIALLEKSTGEAVETAVQGVITKDPAATVNIENFFGKFNEVLNKNGYKVVSGKVTPNVASVADKKTTGILQGILDESKGRITQDGLPLGFVQELKQGMGQLGYETNQPILQQLSGSMNPLKLGVTGKGIAPELKLLRETNERVTTLIPQQKEALAQFTRTGADGKPIADFSRAINAVKGNDRAALTAMRKADMSLPEADRLVPKVERTVREMDKHQVEIDSTIKLAKRKIAKEKEALSRSVREKEFGIRKANDQKKFDRAQYLQGELQEFKAKKAAEIRQAELTFKANEEFVHGQTQLRKFIGEGRAGRLQTVGVLGALSQVRFPNPVSAGVSAGLSLLPSPVLGAGAIKGFGAMADPMTDMAIKAASNPTVRKTLGSLLATNKAKA